MILETLPQVSELTHEQKLLLVAELWDDVNSEGTSIPLSSELADELKRREREYLTDPEGTTTTWDEAKDRIRQGSNGG